MSQKELPTISLFGDDEYSKWSDLWQGMPEFNMEDLAPWNSVIVHFESREDMDNFSKLVQQKITTKTQSLWHPEAEITRYANKRYVGNTSKEKYLNFVDEHEIKPIKHKSDYKGDSNES